MKWLWSVLRQRVLSGLGLTVACLVFPVQAATLELRDAQAFVTVQSQTTQQAIRLPYHWDRHQPGQPGEAIFDVPFTLPQAPTDIYGLYLPRVGNAYEIWLNGILLQRKGDLKNANGADFAKGPRYVVISPGLLGINNLFRVHIRVDLARNGGLAPFIFGPDEEVYPLYLQDYRTRSTSSFFVMIVSLLVGLVSLALWATQVDAVKAGRPRRDPLYLFAGLAELCWSISVSDFIIEKPPLPWPWWGMVPILTTSVWACCMTLFCVEVASWSKLRAATWLRGWLALLFVACVTTATRALVFGYADGLTLVYGVSGLTFLIFVGFFIGKAVRGASLPHRVVAITVLVNALVGAYDLYVMRISPNYGDNTFLRYFSMLFGLTLAYIVILRFRAASAQARDLTANLAARVAQKEQELAQSYQLVEQLAREQARTGERTRILRDMHDGVGAHISTAIRQLESGRATQVEVLHTLRDSLDQLKLSIDAMNLPPGDITALLANLRYRLEPRLKVSGLELQWDVDLLAPLERLDDKAMRHLQYMVFEAVSNVLQHARASKIHIVLCSTVSGGAQLLVIDNGCGFDPELVQRRGLGSLRERAGAMDAGLSLTSVPGETRVEILIR